MIEVKSLFKAYGEKNVLTDVSLTVEGGTIYGLIGKNGAGKTTLLTIVSGLQPADSGSCKVCGVSVTGNTAPLVGYLPDVPAFFDHLTAGEYLDHLFMEKNNPRRKLLLDLVGIPSKTGIKTMSRGMKQRLGIAAVLVNDPQALLLDEPTSALDPQGRLEVGDILRELKSQGKAILLSTHILSDMENICDRVGFLSGGKIVKTLVPDELVDSACYRVTFASPVSPDTFRCAGIRPEAVTPTCLQLQLDGTTTAQQNLFERLQLLSVPVISIDTQHISLDSVFQEVCQ